MKISIIVPIYNAEKYIDRCMSSIYNQTFTDYEIILVNDGSTDNSESICLKYKEKDNRITYIKKENEGAGSARNIGIELAKGGYLAFPDVDDFFEFNMYEKLYQLTDNGKYDVVFSGVNYYKDDKTYDRSSNCLKVQYNTKEECRKNVMTFFPTSTIFDVPWNKLYKRSVILDNNIRFSNTKRCQDAMFNIDFYNVINNACSIDKAYYNYIENTNESVYRKFPIDYIDINIAYFKKLINILSSWNMYKGDIKIHYDSSFIIAIYETMSMFDNPNWNLSKTMKNEYIKNIMNNRYIQSFIDDASIREDVQQMADIIKSKDIGLFLDKYRLVRLKDKLRQNKTFMKVYHIFK